MALKRSSQDKNILLKLLNSGWQSWSTSARKCVSLPSFNFFPHYKTHHKPRLKGLGTTFKKPSYGWCSWYAHGSDIDETKILNQARWIAKNKQKKRLPLDYILIDGGWSTWGDWLEEDLGKFPNGLKSIAQKIKTHNLKPGIWMAPFLVHHSSSVAINHPDWLVRKNGKLVEGLRITPWDKFFSHRKWILDIRNVEVKKYLDESIKYLIETCGFDLLKLDFLYGLHFDPNLTGKEADKILRKFLSDIKKKYPQVYTIACGCPLVPAAGVVDSMRVGPDTSISPFLKMLSLPLFSRWYLNNHVIPTVKKRLWTKKIWNIDPDAYMCRKTIGYTHDQLKRFQKLIKISKGNIFLGDDLTKLSNWRIKKYIQPLFS